MEQKDTRPVMVSIKCLVYNHEPYLRDCLNGFVMQKTNFRFEAIVHDDASTDGSAAIIREYTEKYPDIIKPIYQVENQYSKGDDGHMDDDIINAISHDSKYIAYCEGDDYWIDPYKLQKQVEFMEANPECSLVYSKIKGFNQKLQKVVYIDGKQRSDLKERLLKECCVGTCTTLFRKAHYEEYIKEIQPQTKSWLMGDIPLWLYLGTKGYGKMFNECMGTYRILEESASHSKDMALSVKRIQNTHDIYMYFAEKYNLKTPEIVSVWEGGLLYRVYKTFKQNNQKIPDEYLNRILNYRGNHLRLHIAKYRLKYPLFDIIAGFLIKTRAKITIYFNK